MLFWLSCAVLSAIWRDEYLTSAVRTSLVLTAEVKYGAGKTKAGPDRVAGTSLKACCSAE